MAISHTQITLRTDVVLTNKSPIVLKCMEAQEYVQEPGITGFVQHYIPVEIDQKALVIVTAQKGAKSAFHRHRGGSLRYIISGKYSITYKDRDGQDKTEILGPDDWIFIPREMLYESEALENIKMLHVYEVKNCG
jgi:quercetin dioxygenase-like cupin family protein